MLELLVIYYFSLRYSYFLSHYSFVAVATTYLIPAEDTSLLIMYETWKKNSHLYLYILFRNVKKIFCIILTPTGSLIVTELSHNSEQVCATQVIGPFMQGILEVNH